MHQQLSQILISARRLPFEESELRMVLDAVKVRHSKGADLSLGHPKLVVRPQDFAATAKEGALLLHSPTQLATGFLFVKLEAGRGLFGGQKAVYSSYIGSELTEDSWFAGTVFKSWMIALTSIGNIYRAEGYR